MGLQMNSVYTEKGMTSKGIVMTAHIQHVQGKTTWLSVEKLSPIHHDSLLGHHTRSYDKNDITMNRN
ncbi:hypothetical protein EUGRSUZ_L00090 [Eucalyptus grandis]|uniref:Uncharacterized protein n=1 Tax=Eucalyptus grandis TaxID=71139 RepID=A0A058ZYB9_EUCGR|nr:hypothetical protein EUGRSUZ_L00090 [Eucalyptus grandis]